MSANKAFSVGPMLRHSRGWRTQLPTIWMSSCELMPGSQTRRTAGQRRPGQRQRDESGRGPGMHGSHGASTRRPMGAWTLASAEARRHRADVTILERIASHPSAPQRQPASHEPNFSHRSPAVRGILPPSYCVFLLGAFAWIGVAARSGITSGCGTLCRALRRLDDEHVLMRIQQLLPLSSVLCCSDVGASLAPSQITRSGHMHRVCGMWAQPTSVLSSKLWPGAHLWPNGDWPW